MMFSTLLLALSPLAALAHSSSHHSSLSKRSSSHVSKRATSTLDDADTVSISYSGNWTQGSVNEGVSLSWTDDADASYNFTTPKGATGIVITSTLKADRGAFQVLKDGKVVGNGTTHSGSSNKTSDEAETDSQVVFRTNITDKAKHVWKVVKTSPKGTYLSLDAVQISGVKAPNVTTKGYQYGGNNYFLYSMADGPRRDLLDQMQKAGMTFARIFLTHVGAGSKGSDSIDVPDVEPSQVGEYDDTILESIDQLMYDASQRGIRLLIALHDRYALGFWGTDQYAYKYGIVSQGSSGAQRVGDASAFYTSDSASQEMDARFTHIMNHRNKLMGNKRWADLPEGIFAVEPQNEPMGHMDVVDPNWVCARATTLKKLVGNSGIMVGTGGGIDISSSQQSWNTDCAAYDAIMVHDYGTNADSSVAALAAMKAKYEPQGKTIIFEEWGATGGGKTQQIQSFVDALKKAQVSWSYWEITSPGEGENDFEIWINEPGWAQGLMQGGNAPFSNSNNKREPEPEANAAPASVSFGVRSSRPRMVRRSQASKRNTRPVERVA